MLSASLLPAIPQGGCDESSWRLPPPRLNPAGPNDHIVFTAESSAAPRRHLCKDVQFVRMLVSLLTGVLQDGHNALSRGHFDSSCSSCSR